MQTADLVAILVTPWGSYCPIVPSTTWKRKVPNLQNCLLSLCLLHWSHHQWPQNFFMS